MFKRIMVFMAVAMLLLACIYVVAAYAGGGFSSSTLLRVTDGVGQQYRCVSSSHVNKYGFGGSADTLTTDSTVSRGTNQNVKRIKESGDVVLSELLAQFLSTRSQLDSASLYNKWSSIVWALNNAFADSGGLSGIISARSGGRLSPAFARVARANGVYLSPKAVFQDSFNFGSGVLGTDSAWTYSDSANGDSSLYGPAKVQTSLGNVYKQFVYQTAGFTGSGNCSLLVYFGNQSYTHERKAAVYIGQLDTYDELTPAVVGDSIYSIDSVKVRRYSGTIAGTILFKYRCERPDTL